LVNVRMELENFLRSSVRSRASAIRLELREHPDLPIGRPHVSVSLALPRALASWGIPPACGLRLVACSFPHLASPASGGGWEGARASSGLSRSECPFGVVLGRYFTPGQASGCHAPHDSLVACSVRVYNRAANDQSLLGQLISRLAGSA